MNQCMIHGVRDHEMMSFRKFFTYFHLQDRTLTVCKLV